MCGISEPVRKNRTACSRHTSHFLLLLSQDVMPLDMFWQFK